MSRLGDGDGALLGSVWARNRFFRDMADGEIEHLQSLEDFAQHDFGEGFRELIEAAVGCGVRV